MQLLILIAGAAAVAIAAGAVYVARLARGAGTSWRRAFGSAFVGEPSGPLGRVGARLMASSKRSFFGVVAEQLDLQPDDELLDVGCGAAGLLRDQAEHVRFVAGVDASDIQVDLARHELADRIAEGTAEIVRGDAQALPWEDGRFSVVTSVDSIRYVADPAQALREIHRVLRPGGRAVLALGERIADDLESGALDAWGQWQWNEADAAQLMEDAGFPDVSVSFLSRGGSTGAMGAPDAQLVRGTK